MQNSKLGVVFPGQGSQKVGMLGDFSDNILIRNTFTEASAVLDYDLWDLIQAGPDTELAKTHITQPAILTASVALWRLYRDQDGVVPAIMAGHSLARIFRAHLRRGYPFADAVALVQKRGQYMQSAVPLGVGAMAAIVGLDDDKVIAACKEAGQGEGCRR